MARGLESEKRDRARGAATAQTGTKRRVAQNLHEAVKRLVSHSTCSVFLPELDSRQQIREAPSTFGFFAVSAKIRGKNGCFRTLYSTQLVSFLENIARAVVIV